MLRRLRWQLTLLYVGVALGLVALVSLGAFTLLGYYFQRQTDTALGYKMALTFRQFDVPLPPALAQVEADWRSGKTTGLALTNDRFPPATITASFTSSSTSIAETKEKDDEDEYNEEAETAEYGYLTGDHDEELERYDSQLASIYVLPINANGQIILSPGSIAPPYGLNREAVNAAFTYGADLRTVRATNQEKVRILTYRLDSSEGPYFFQVGRSLADQNRLSNQFLLGLLLLGALCSALVGAASWWLSGKSILPAQISWDQQQNFISNASHELRTPLTLIRASAEVLARNRNTRTDNEQSALVNDILNECDYMDRLVNDLLLLSRLDTRRLILMREHVELAELMEETAAVGRKLAGEKQINVEAGAVQGSVLGDHQRLRQALLILLDNAVRHTQPGGKIRLEANLVGEKYQLSVNDNGAGIPPQHLPYVFDRFYQATSSSEDQGRGNGLGLSIARGIVEAQGGAIFVTSQLGKGTRVTIELPMAISLR